MDPNWCLPNKLKHNPLVWMISVDGFILDARSAPKEIQEVAYAKGFIPYIPEDSKLEDVIELETPLHQSKKQAYKSNALYLLDVFLIDGPVSSEFIEENPEVSRTIEIRGDNTLEDLHKIIFKAFDREDEHMYEFQVGGCGLQDPNARRYGLKQELSTEALAGDVSNTTIASLELSIDEAFGYWFDFGDDWWHQIDVVDITEKAKSSKNPKVINRIGVSPPQYTDFE